MQNKISLFTLSIGLLLGSSNICGKYAAKDDKSLASVATKKKRKKRRSRSTFNAGPILISKGIRDQTVEELEHNLDIYLKKGKTSLCIKYLEAMIPKLTDFGKIRDARLKLADLCYDYGKYDKAGSIYTEYFEAYPGYKDAEYALYRAIVSKYKQVGACDQDNLLTKDVLDLSKKYLKNKSYKKYHTNITNLLSKCNNQLFDAEVKVFEHYFRRGNIRAAARRLDYIKDKVLPKVPNAKSKVDVLESLITQAKDGKSPAKLLRSANALEKMLSAKTVKNTDVKNKKVKTKSYASRF